MIAVIAHWPISVVNLYVENAWLLIAGYHITVTASPLFNEVGNEHEPPTEKDTTWISLGFVAAFAITVIVDIIVHWPSAGVKLFVLIEGLKM